MALNYFASYVLASTFFTFVILLYLFYKEKFKYWKNKNVPYIEPTIPFGNALDLFLGRITFGQLYSKAYHEFKRRGYKHGGIYFFWKPVYIPVDETIIKRILITDFEYFSNHGFYTNAKYDPLTTHIFNMEDYKWKTVRAKLPSAFTTTKMRKMFSVMVKYSNIFIHKLEDLVNNHKEIEIKSELAKLSTDTVASCIFGIETNTMDSMNSELLKHGRLFFDYQWDLLRNTLSFCVPKNVLERLGFKVFKEETNRFVFSFFEEIKKYRMGMEWSRDDLAEKIIKMTFKDENEKDFRGETTMDPMNPDEYVSQMFVFFCAGFETSSSTQTFALYELAKNTSCQMKLRDEICSVLAKHDNVITYDAVSEMKYLENLVDETLRLYPIFPLIPRLTGSDYLVPGTNVVIEKNTFVVVSNMGIHTDPDYYPNSEQFDPDTFLPENKAKRPCISHLPFGEGPRICIGKRFGLLQTKVGLINIIKNFEVTLASKTSAGCRFSSNELLLRKSGDVWLTLKRIC